MRVERDQIRTLLVLVGLTGLFAVAVWMPLQARHRELKSQIRSVEQQARAERRSTVGLTALGEQIVALRKTVNGQEKRIPEQADLASLLRQWSRELENRQVTDLEIQTQPVVHGADYSMAPITLKFRSSFGAVFGFLRYIESMPRVTRLSRLTLNADPANDDENALVVHLELSTFYMPEGEQPS